MTFLDFIFQVIYVMQVLQVRLRILLLFFFQELVHVFMLCF